MKQVGKSKKLKSFEVDAEPLRERALTSLFKWMLMGTRGGPTRLLILMRLRDGPANTNQLATALRLNYKTIQHHLEILLENKMVERDESGYGARYRLSQMLAENTDIFEEIVEEVFGKRVGTGFLWGRSG